MDNYIVTPRAEKDIEEILAFIAVDNLDAAIAFYGRLIDRFRLLATSPGIGRKRPEIKQDLRSTPEGNYIVFYREWAGVVAIVRVLHGSRDIEEIFKN